MPLRFLLNSQLSSQIGDIASTLTVKNLKKNWITTLYFLRDIPIRHKWEL